MSTRPNATPRLPTLHQLKVPNLGKQLRLQLAEGMWLVFEREGELRFPLDGEQLHPEASGCLEVSGTEKLPALVPDGPRTVLDSDVVVLGSVASSVTCMSEEEVDEGGGDVPDDVVHLDARAGRRGGLSKG